MAYDPKDPHAIHWTPGLPPEPVDDIIPLTVTELKIARGTYNPSDTLSRYPCPCCGYAISGFALNACKRCKGRDYTRACMYCKHHGLSKGTPKYGDECSICGPIKVESKGGLHPRKATVVKKKHKGAEVITYTCEEVVYDLLERLPGPES